MIKITIAGTSSGGSSYTPRIMQAVTEAEQFDVGLEIYITEGKAKHLVMKKVETELAGLRRFVTNRGGRRLPHVEIR